MYYVLFHYSKGQKDRDFRGFRSDDDVIKFLHEKYREIDVYQIIETARSYHLGLVVTEELIKSVLEPEEAEILKENKKTLEELEAGEPSAMSKIAEDIEKEQEEELTDKEKAQAAMDDADNLIEREKKRQEEKKKGWKLCTKCNSNKVAPWNKKEICSPCQQTRKKPKLD